MRNVLQRKRACAAAGIWGWGLPYRNDRFTIGGGVEIEFDSDSVMRSGSHFDQWDR
jgi:hypothetical protein